ncbi:uncharacterized protein ASCRUDRAFT_74557 [Ascoidea rubescens DSM 1968]|uniref:C2H2-type domain-containing protein n=1 Tax=Ascoidea rubescens DSM 1968 TaxID=1344418 RepID=A0A1D2VNK0_9ASCO|nr:hypothetical protein ASCRUDRAFT_74557 [Ascoidea rubescens DSM 1968]ODV63180.1 hypothetical protein ASCRUDRAFT_74557 [Ascoidea rubescens DSM 1968]
MSSTNTANPFSTELSDPSSHFAFPPFENKPSNSLLLPLPNLLNKSQNPSNTFNQSFNNPYSYFNPVANNNSANMNNNNNNNMNNINNLNSNMNNINGLNNLNNANNNNNNNNPNGLTINTINGDLDLKSRYPLKNSYDLSKSPTDKRPLEKKKRPRRKHDEIERVYMCKWSGCTKGYGTLNHLNAHVLTQNHGLKRKPEEFREIRAQLRERRKKAAESSKLQQKERANSLPSLSENSLPLNSIPNSYNPHNPSLPNDLIYNTNPPSSFSLLTPPSSKSNMPTLNNYNQPFYKNDSQMIIGQTNLTPYSLLDDYSSSQNNTSSLANNTNNPNYINNYNNFKFPTTTNSYPNSFSANHSSNISTTASNSPLSSVSGASYSYDNSYNQNSNLAYNYGSSSQNFNYANSNLNSRP